MGQRIKPVKLRWTQAWLRMNKKGKTEDAARKRTRRAQKFQRAIVGMSLEDIKKKKAQKPELRQQAKDAAAKEAKQRMQNKGKPGKAAAPKANQTASEARKAQKATKQGAAPAPNKKLGKR